MSSSDNETYKTLHVHKPYLPFNKSFWNPFFVLFLVSVNPEILVFRQIYTKVWKNFFLKGFKRYCGKKQIECFCTIFDGLLQCVQLILRSDGDLHKHEYSVSLGAGSVKGWRMRESFYPGLIVCKLDVRLSLEINLCEKWSRRLPPLHVW